ncbi:hypothetical protein N8925_00375 [Candidatus Pelagibacter sp.]|nr:hypothetical protein [Candidatus Pelagibacter sp.]
MKPHKENLIIFISIIFSFCIGTFIWEYINFKFVDPKILGNYTLSQHDAKNDIFRYVLFVFIPTFTYISIKFYTDKNIFKKIYNLKKNDHIDIRIDNSLLFLLFLVLFFLFLQFFSIEFPDHKIDSYHDGQRLSSAFKSHLDNTLWSGSYVTVGIFYETLSTKIIWNLFDNVTIGLARFTEIFYILLLKICLIYLSFIFTKFLKLNNLYKNFFFLFNSLVFLSLSDYNTVTTDLISFREIPIIITFILFIHFLISSHQKKILFLISILSISSLLWSIDRGLICNFLIFLIALYLVITSDFKNFLILISFLILSWFMSFLIIGHEFNYFFDNTISVYKEMNYIHGLIHPTPFSSDDNASRATKTIILISFCLLVSLSSLFNSNKYFSNRMKVILFYFSIICFLSYLYALGRSDGPHIKNSFGYPIIFISIYFSYLCFIKISNLNLKISKIFIYTSVGFFIFIFLSKLNYSNVIKYNERFKIFSNLPDLYFMNKNEAQFVNEISPLIESFNCIQLFSNDAIFNYLLKKKSCTKFYFVWSAASLNKQNEFISELNNTEIIISGGQKNNWDMPLSKKMFVVQKYIDENYYLYKSINKWNILLSKK